MRSTFISLAILLSSVSVGLASATPFPALAVFFGLAAVCGAASKSG